MWSEWFWFFLVMLAFFAGMGAMWLIEREIDEEAKASDGVFLGSMCGCKVSVRGRFYGILYCPEHEAAEEMYEALSKIGDYRAAWNTGPDIVVNDMKGIARNALALVDDKDGSDA